jgi:hypothetical protein
MKPHSEELSEVRSYLLGTLSEEEQRRFEERLLTEDDSLEELIVSEEDLIDDYVNDDLPADARLRFEQHFLCTPARQEMLRFAVALGGYTSQASDPVANKSRYTQTAVVPASPSWSARFKSFWSGQSVAFRFAAAAAVVVIVAVTTLLIIPGMFTPKTFATATLSLSSGDRGEGPAITRVKLAQEVDALRLFLKLPASSVSAQGYRVELLDEKLVTRTLEIAGKDGQSLVVEIPARDLRRGEYALLLYAINSDGSEQRINGSYLLTVE